MNRPAPGVAGVRLSGLPAGAGALAAVLAGIPAVQILTGPDGPCPSRRQPGHRLYLTLRLTPVATTETGGITMTEPAEPAIDDGYAQAAAEDRAEALAVYYEQAQAEVDAEARYLATQADRDAELDARQMDAQHQEALAENAARQAQTREPEAGV